MANVYSAEGELSYAKRISWGAIFAGTFVAIGVEIILALLGMAVGGGTLRADQGGLKTLGTGEAIWWFISGLIALFCGGWVAGRVSNCYERLDAALNGLVSWAFVAIISLAVLTTSLGALIGGALGTVRQGVASAASNPQVTQQLQNRADQLMNRAERSLNNPQSNQGTLSPQDKANAEAAARTAAKAAWTAFFALLLGAVCAALGGMEALPKNEGLEHRGTAGNPAPQMSR